MTLPPRIGAEVHWKTAGGHTLSGTVMKVNGTGVHATALIHITGAINATVNANVRDLLPGLAD